MEWGDVYAGSNADVQYVWICAIGMEEKLEDEHEASEEFHKILSEALNLVRSCENLVQRTHAANQDLHLKQLKRVRNAIFAVNAGSWHTFRSNFNDDFMMSPRWAAENLSNYWHEEVIQEEELASIQSEVGALIERLVASNLEPDLKTVLIASLGEVRNAIPNYRILGADEIRKAVDSNIGVVARHAESIQGISDDEDKQVVSAVLGLVSKVNQLATAALNLKALGEGAVKLLSIGGAG